MTNHFSLSDELRPIFEQYFESFSKKEYIEENNDYDVLMEVFGITPELKRENRQYWGRELGMVWEKTLELIAKHHNDYLPRFRIDRDEPVDFLLGADAIDTKYRIGSGDAGTLKKLRQYASQIKLLGYNPVLLVLRTDNLPTAVSACRNGGWDVLTGEDSLNYIRNRLGVNLESVLSEYGNTFHIKRRSGSGGEFGASRLSERGGSFE